MSRIRWFFDKDRLILYSSIIAIAFVVFTLVEQRPKVSIKPVTESKMTEAEKLSREVEALRQRLAAIEPESPVKIVSSEHSNGLADSLRAESVILEGAYIPFSVVYEDSSWVRPDYQPYWHSKKGPWSSMAERVHNAHHRLFVSTATKALWNETAHNVGIAELAGKIRLPVRNDRPEDTIVIVTLQHKVENIMILDNQVVLWGTPGRKGLQVICLDRRDLIQSSSGDLIALNNRQEYLFQAVTPDGFEIDYNNVVINYE